MQSQEQFRATLRHYRKQHGISQTELASAAGMAQPTIAGFETGHSNLSTDSMDRIGTALLKLIGDRASRATDALVSYRHWLSSGDMRAGA
jgi:transcriptional regulator with XRE-family HTH domain